MYTRTKEFIKSKKLDPNLFIEKNEYNNSELLYKLDAVTEYSYYTITKNEHRIDLIAEDIYNSEKYSWILLYINRIGLDDLVRGTIIKYIPLTTLNNIIDSV